jgi:outer membrane protein assembly factor BamB
MIGGMRTLALLVVLTTPVLAQDWPQWRGVNRDGSVIAFREPTNWPETLRQRWKIEVGTGYATPLRVNDRLFVFSRQGEEEVMSALDAAGGRLIWRSGYAVPFTPMRAAARHGPGPKSTPVFADGRLFSLGMTSIVTAFDAATGKRLWQTAATPAQPMYHTAMSPIVENNSVIVHVGGPGDSALSAFDAATGAVRWTWNGDSPAYGSPIVATLAGVRQLVTFTHRNLVSVDVRTGALLWQRPFRTPSDTTAQTPIVFRDTIIQNGRDNGVTAFRVIQRDGAWTTEDIWQTKDVSLHMTNGVVSDDVLYGLSHLNAGQYFAIDLRDGRVLWKSEPRQAENAGMVSAGTAIFSLEDDGELVVLRANRERFDVVRRYAVADSPTWAQPVVAAGRVYVRDLAHLTLWALD